MTESEYRAVLAESDAALEVHRTSAGNFNAAQIRARRLLQVLRDQVAEDFARDANPGENSANPKSSPTP
jgi:hypothetical protein